MPRLLATIFKNFRKLCFFFLGILFLSFLPVSSVDAFNPPIRVQIFSRYNLSDIEVRGELARIELVDAKRGKGEAKLPPGIGLRIQASGKRLQTRIGSGTEEFDQLTIEPPRGTFLVLRTGPNLQRKLEGKLFVRSVKNSLFLIEELPLEDYVRGVLESEIPRDFPIEALKAQAVLIRTYALAHLDRHRKEGFHFCDLTHCQAYGGKNITLSNLDAAVEQTREIILTHQLQPIEALYHSTCGGHTSPNQRVFGGKALPYLQGVSDENYCAASPHAQWESTISLSLLEEILKKDPKLDPHGELSTLQIVDREERGRAFQLMLEGRKNFTIPVFKFLSAVGKAMGWSTVKSNWFEVRIEKGEAHFKGKGLGHGIGLCQWGARGRAIAGKKFDEILMHYFPETRLIER